MPRGSTGGGWSTAATSTDPAATAEGVGLAAVGPGADPGGRRAARIRPGIHPSQPPPDRACPHLLALTNHRAGCAPSTRVVVRHYASPACLEAARRADHLIDLLIRNQRRQVEDLLVAYTVAAQQCRKDATPTP